ncbi:MAG: FimV/HubP family polar landmark protein [Xanthomonadales bacterium]
MKTRNYCYTQVLLAASLLAFSQLAWSLGLGEAKLESFLGQPLVVKIELITSPADDLASVSAGLAAGADYELIGASRDDVSVPLRFSVENLDGNAYIAVNSTLDINNPVLRLILEVNWSRGRMLREYTLFLDPPTFSQPAPAPRIEAATAAPRSRPAAATATATATATAATTVGDAAILGADDYYPVQGGDTLWRITRDWSAGRRLNLNKVMLAIQRLNPEAFSSNNINLLQRGAILYMPQRDDVNSISAASASSEVKRQADAFQSRRNRIMAVPILAEESVATEPAVDEQIAQQAVAEPLSGDEAPPSASPDLVPADPAPSQLEILPPSEDNSSGSASGFEQSEVGADDAESALALQEKLSRKEEELINQQQQNTYLERRLQELESQLAERREATLEDENLASMEQRLRQERLADPQTTAVPKVVSSPPQEEPWYNRLSLWLLGLLVLMVVLLGWLMSHRGSTDKVVADRGGAPDPLREFKKETETVRRAPDSTAEETVADQEVAQDQAAEEVVAAPAEAPATGESEAAQTEPAGKNLFDEDEDAHVLDEESADPEIQLDLARAYISMGDKEAARVILEEVIVNGSEQQQADANKMKDML